ncbi:hypothetical protein DPX39_000024600 [Trypanosoma brucei equiperdum]|uniref:Uncharacterized protein n=1 Tax=Trypanosoma brucei equiperdum TaxID=630700 RepID=A0A3L6KYH8_9TRYP|nr:hypothetical protein DPX39_000024600 [Trypanosoma brucei equiperdum]
MEADANTFNPRMLRSANIGLAQPLDFVSTKGKHVVGNLHGVVFNETTTGITGGVNIAATTGNRTAARGRRRRTGI